MGIKKKKRYNKRRTEKDAVTFYLAVLLPDPPLFLFQSLPPSSSCALHHWTCTRPQKQAARTFCTEQHGTFFFNVPRAN